MFLMGPQVCTASVLAKDPSNVDRFLASQKANVPDPSDPNDFGTMPQAKLDEEFPIHAFDNSHHSGLYDFRSGHMAILDTPQKMDPEWQAEQHLKAVNAMSGRHASLLLNKESEGIQDNDEND